LSKPTNLVQIENSTKKFTSLGRALSFVRRGHAEWIEPQKKIRFLDIAQAMRTAHEQVEQHLLDERGGVMFWNGSDHNPLATHRPGEARS